MRTRGSLWSAPKATQPKTTDEWCSLCQEVASDIGTGAFVFKGLRKVNILTKPGLTTNDLATVLTLRKINDNVRRAYGIRQTRRQHAIQLAKAALAEPVSKGVIRLDLKSCFETIKSTQLLAKLRADSKVSRQTLALIEQLLRSTQQATSKRLAAGLTRGLLTSSTFAEVMLRPLDMALNEIPDVYLMIRYVDDILLFTTTDPESLQQTVRKVVAKNGFTINESKFFLKTSGCNCALNCTHAHGKCPCNHGEKCICDDAAGNYEHLDFLGYQLIFRTRKDCGNTPTYAVLSDRKCSRLKARIAISIKAYLATSDLALLRDRMRVLTDNCVLRKTARGRKLLSGLVVTHPEYSEPPSDCITENRLGDLDNFLQTSLRRCFAKNKTPIPAELRKLSFENGFRNRRRVKLPAPRMRAVRSCWKNV